MITTSLYAVYAGAATFAVAAGDTLTQTAGGALAAYVVGRLALHRHRSHRGRGSSALVTVPSAQAPAA